LGLAARKNPRTDGGAISQYETWANWAGLRLHVNNPGLRDLIGFSTSLHHIGQGPEFLVLAQRLQDLEHVLAGPIVSSSEKEVVLGRGKMSSREMVRNVRG
jgi:hypothetical protein